MRLYKRGFATSAFFSIFLSFVQSQENFEVSTVVDGSTQQEPFNNVAILPDGSVLLSDKTKHCVWKFTEGEVTLYAGMPGSLGNKDGKGTLARFCHPTMLATDEDGNAYVVDNATAVRRITPSGDVVTIAGSSTIQTPKEGAGQAAAFAPLSDLLYDPSTCSLLVAEPGTRRIRSVRLRQQCKDSGGGDMAASWLPEGYLGLLGALLVGFLAGVGATVGATRVQTGGGIASVGPTTLRDAGHFFHRTYEAGAGIVRHGADRLSHLWPTHPASQPTNSQTDVPFLAKQSTSSPLAATLLPHSAKQASSESGWEHPDLMDLEGPERGDGLSGLVGEPELSGASITWEERGDSDHKCGRGSETRIGSVSSGLTSVGSGSENLTSRAVPTGQFPVLKESVQFVARQNREGGSKGSTLQ